MCSDWHEKYSLLCTECLTLLPRPLSPCASCAQSRVAKQQSKVCGQCLRVPPPIDACFAAFLYAAPITLFIQGLKYQDKRFYAPFLAGVLTERLKAYKRGQAMAVAGRESWPQALIPVPLHPKRQAERGYNQAALLSRHLSKQLGIQSSSTWVERIKNTCPQQSLSAKQRQTNTRQAFACSQTNLPAHVAIIDDVMTTGATVFELAKTLRQQTAVQRIDVWIIARAMPATVDNKTL